MATLEKLGKYDVTEVLGKGAMGIVYRAFDPNIRRTVALKTIRKELLAERTFTTIEQAQAELDAWVARYNGDREHQGIGDVPPARRFELVQRPGDEVVDPEATEDLPPAAGRTVRRRVDRAGRCAQCGLAQLRGERLGAAAGGPPHQRPDLRAADR